ncbi:Tetraspanin/Peripherin [Corchorus olitorius]|uniref:Tetraspanin/Peripherin n=1 Tax=Corchorus olitorius TaxID=93759 RepID=A0A1R3KAN4_9ROSI|nr:Tetraspanin/Peripherin [Corchorus olitorius]
MFYIANSSSQTKDFVQKTWAQEMVGKNWPSVKNCLLQGQFCQAMAKNSTATSLEEFKMEKRNIVENVCCMPPEDCGFVFKNATYWEVPVTGLVKNDGDCKVWNNQIDGKCYDCDKCKEMFVGDLRKDALYIGIALICETVFVLITFCIGCCARKNNKQTKYNP